MALHVLGAHFMFFCPFGQKNMVAGPGAREAPSLLLKLPQFLVFNLKNNR